MCGVCGCSDGDKIAIEGRDGRLHEHDHVALKGEPREHGHAHAHHGEHEHHHHHHGEHGHHHHHHGEHGHHHHDEHGHHHQGHHPDSSGHGDIAAAKPTPRVVQVERDLLAKNDRYARLNRKLFQASGIRSFNLMSSPGSGKTTLLVETLKRLTGRRPVAVIEGDQQTTFDADRIRATGAPAIQVNTGKVCHLDASMVTEAMGALDLDEGGILFIENVGNLVCPAGFDLGEGAKVVVVSVTEGEDKPLKYPEMFAVADLVVVNKVDLLPHLDFDLERLKASARAVRPGVPIIEVSARTGAGFGDWLGWLEGPQTP